MTGGWRGNAALQIRYSIYELLCKPELVRQL